MPKEFCVLEAGHMPAKSIKLDNASFLIVGTQTVFFPREVFHVTAMRAYAFLNWEFGLGKIPASYRVVESVEEFSSRRDEFSNDTIVILSATERPALPRNIHVRHFEYVTLRDVMQNLSRRLDVGYFVSESGDIRKEESYHTAVRLELSGGQKFSFEKPIKRKVDLD